MKKKLKLKELEVQSFVTSIKASNVLKGGGGPGLSDLPVCIPTILPADCHQSDACPSAVHTCNLPVC